MSLLRPPLGDDDHVLGDARASVTLVEFGDFECPFCGRAAGIVAALREALGDRLRFGFRNFPLETMHPHALVAAEAAEAAAAQGQFWPMYDLLYRHQDALTVPDLVGYAQRLELDIDLFTGDLTAHRHRERIRTDLHSGALSGVNGTPTFFIDGTRHDGAWDYDALLAAIVHKSNGRIRLEEPLVRA